jgi:hypothetical protein
MIINAWEYADFYKPVGVELSDDPNGPFYTERGGPCTVMIPHGLFPEGGVLRFPKGKEDGYGYTIREYKVSYYRGGWVARFLRQFESS